MAHRFLFLGLCLPVILDAFITHFFPEQALVSFLITAFFYCLMGIKFYKTKTYSPLIWVIFLLGIALRFFYIAYNPIYFRQQDVGQFTEEGRGHFQYIYYILKYHTLPFLHSPPILPIYHPPLYHILAALFLSLTSVHENLQYLTLICATGCALFSYFFLRTFLKTNQSRLIAALFCSFFPTFIYFSGKLNNDALSTFLTLASVFFFLQHLTKPGIKNLVLSAFLLGLASMTKFTTVLFFLGIGFYYLSALILRQITFKQAVKEGLIFNCIYLPLMALWPICILIRWGTFQGFSAHQWYHFSIKLMGYNPFLHLDTTSIDPLQYVGGYSLLERLGPIFEPLSYPFVLRGAWLPTQYPEYNVWLCLIKSALFDEWALFKLGATPLQTIGFDFSVILLLLGEILFCIFLWSFFKVKRRDKVTVFCQSVLLMVMAGFIHFCFWCPVFFACLFRYIAALFPFCCYFVIQYLQKNLASSTTGHQKIKKTIGYGLVLFSVLSGFVYTLYGALSF